MNDVDWRALWRQHVKDLAEPWDFTLARFRADIEARMKSHSETLEEAAAAVGALWQAPLRRGEAIENGP